MSLLNQRISLLLIWLTSFTACIIMIFLLFYLGWIAGDTLKYALTRVSAIYSPFLGTMLLFFWTLNQSKQNLKATKTPFLLAVITSVIWNSILISLLSSIWFGDLALKEAIDLASSITEVLNWIVSGAVGYYFAHSIMSNKNEI